MVPLWRGAGPLILASTSATRRDLLRAAGLDPVVEAPGVDERALEAELGADARSLAAGLARAKALAVSARNPGAFVIGADQTLEVESEILHKPDGRAAAAAQVARLAGRAHALHSAVAIARDGAVLEAVADTARLTVRPLTDDAIARYLDLAGEAVTRSVGAYQLEGAGIHLFERVEGEHSTILGLPLLPLLAAMRRRGLLAF
jgi:septum formation protein